MDTIRAFLFKLRILFSIFKKKKGRPLFSLLVALLRVAEYASISLNMPKYR